MKCNRLHGVDRIEKERPKIRLFKKTDINEVLGIESKSFPNPWSEDMFETLYYINPNGFYIAQKENKIVGYAVLLTERGWKHWSKKRTAHLLNLAVHPRYKRQKIGTLLMKRILSDLKNLKISEIYLEVRTSNSKAITLYTKLGFEKMGEIRGFYKNEDAQVMALKL